MPSRCILAAMHAFSLERKGRDEIYCLWARVHCLQSRPMYELYDSSLFVEPVIFIYIHVVFVRVQFKLNNVTNPRRRRSVNKKDNSAS